MNISKNGHTYFRYANKQLFGTIKSSVAIAATNFPSVGDQTIEEVVNQVCKEGEPDNAIEDFFNKVADVSSIALTVSYAIAGSDRQGATIILTEKEQDDLILGILERRGKKGIGDLISRIGLELPDEPLKADTGDKSKFQPSNDIRLPGEGPDGENKHQEKKGLLASLLITSLLNR